MELFDIVFFLTCSKKKFKFVDFLTEKMTDLVHLANDLAVE